MAHMYFPVDLLNRFCNDAFEKFGFTKQHVVEVAMKVIAANK